MEKEYLSIKQIAEKLKVSKQRVYRCIKKNCIKEAHSETVNGNTVLMYDETAFSAISELLNGGSGSASDETHDAHHEPHHKVHSDTLNEALYEALLKQLEEKDKQIAEMQKLLDQAQQLHALEQQKVLALESKMEAVESEPEEQPKKRWWQFWQ